MDTPKWFGYISASKENSLKVQPRRPHVDFPAVDHSELGLRPITTKQFGNTSSEPRVHIHLGRKTLKHMKHFEVLKRGIPDTIQQRICGLTEGCCLSVVYYSAIWTFR